MCYGGPRTHTWEGPPYTSYWTRHPSPSVTLCCTESFSIKEILFRRGHLARSEGLLGWSHWGMSLASGWWRQGILLRVSPCTEEPSQGRITRPKGQSAEAEKPCSNPSQSLICCVCRFLCVRGIMEIFISWLTAFSLRKVEPQEGRDCVLFHIMSPGPKTAPGIKVLKRHRMSE